MLLTPATRSTLRPRRGPGPTRFRLATRVAAGLSAREAARAEGLPADEAAALLARPYFARLVQDFRRLASLGREERLARLEALAFDVLEDAIGAGDVRVVLWFLSERHAGRDPIRRVAEAVVRQAERAGTSPPAAPTRARGASPPTAGTPATSWPARSPPERSRCAWRSRPPSWPASRAGRAAPPPSAAASGRWCSHPCRPPA